MAMLAKDIVIGGFVNYVLVFHGKRIRYLSRVLTNYNGKANLECYDQKTGILKRFCVRIKEIQPLSDDNRKLLESLAWDQIPHEKMQKYCLKAELF